MEIKVLQKTDLRAFWPQIFIEESQVSLRKIWQKVKTRSSKGTHQKLLSGFCPLRGPPPTPLTENHFAKKTLAERGGTPPPLTENCRKFSSKKGSKRAKIGVFLAKNSYFLAEFFLNGIRGYPPPP